MSKQTIWSYLIHLGYNMWLESTQRDGNLADGYAEDYCCASDKLRFDRDLFLELLPRMQAAGINTLLIDLGEGLQYESHPEISCTDAVSKAEFASLLAKVREHGIAPIPKLNFSACHDEWMGPYARKVSTPEYYKACADLIAEVYELFDSPEYFHLGMDEETFDHQKLYAYKLVRDTDLWWADLNFYTKQVTDRGARPWLWADRVWNHPNEFLARMPKDFLLSNWYYGIAFSRSLNYIEAYHQLDDAGFEQVPTGGNWRCQWNFEGTVNYCEQHLTPSLLLGFMQTVWRPTLNAVKYRHFEAVHEVAKNRRPLRSE
ncbi:MAG: Tat pathway signal protein [Clostridiaceae bacterium]|nr:Tat pathway signal protein [Clostridiaceae bacterium]